MKNLYVAKKKKEAYKFFLFAALSRFQWLKKYHLIPEY